MMLMTETRKRRLTTKLAKARRHCPLIDQEMALATGEIARQRVGQTTVFVDAGNRVTSDCGRMVAERAIATHGKLGWVVSNMRGFQWVAVDDPFEAFDIVADGIVAAPRPVPMAGLPLAMRRVGVKIPFFSAS